MRTKASKSTIDLSSVCQKTKLIDHPATITATQIPYDIGMTHDSLTIASYIIIDPSGRIS